MAINMLENGICVVVIRRSPAAKPLVEIAAFYPIAGGAVSDAELKKITKELQATQYVITTLLKARDYQLLSVDAPNVPPDELKTAIRWRLKDMLDFHIDNATIDVLDVPLNKNASVRTHSMYAVAVHNQIIEQRQALFLQLKLPLAVIDVPEMAQRNISVFLEPEGRGVALLSFDTDGGLLTVTYSSELYLSRRIDATLMQVLESDPKQREACFSRIALELQRSLDHFDRQYHFISLTKIMLAPLADEDCGLQGYLAANLYLPVENLDLTSILDFSRAPALQSLARQQQYFMTLGAALRHEEMKL
jgi:MSHA biogenesis protein MshI